MKLDEVSRPFEESHLRTMAFRLRNALTLAGHKCGRIWHTPSKSSTRGKQNYGFHLEGNESDFSNRATIDLHIVVGNILESFGRIEEHFDGWNVDTSYGEYTVSVFSNYQDIPSVVITER